jgi:Transposase domain (DUF772)
VSLNLAHRWYLGYALDEDLSDHSSLTRIRQRLGVEIFERFFERIVDLCQEAGLVWGHELFFDATKVHANADLDSLVPRFYHDAKCHVSGLFADDLVAEDEHKGDGADPPPLGDVIGSPEGAAPEQAPRWKLLEERRLDPDRPAVGSYRRTTDFRVSVIGLCALRGGATLLDCCHRKEAVLSKPAPQPDPLVSPPFGERRWPPGGLARSVATPYSKGSRHESGCLHHLRHARCSSYQRGANADAKDQRGPDSYPRRGRDHYGLQSARWGQVDAARLRSEETEATGSRHRVCRRDRSSREGRHAIPCR